MTGEKHSDKHQYRHRRSSMDFHRPNLCSHCKIARRREQIRPIRPCRTAKEKQRKNDVEKPSLQTVQSNWVRSGLWHDELNLQEGAASRSNISASARYCLSKSAACWRRTNTIFVNASAVIHSAAATLTLISFRADRPVHPSINGVTYCVPCFRRVK